MVIGHIATPMSAGPLTIISTSDGGATWTTGSFPSSQVTFANDIACASATACTVVGEAATGNGSGLALATTDEGATWTTESTPTADDYVGISCPAVGACTAVGIQTGASATGGAIIIGQAPITSVLIPSNGTALSGTRAVLDASASAAAGVASVQFVITGESYSQSVIGKAIPTLYGYIFEWNTTGVPDGAYTVQSLVTDGAGNTAYSAGVPITVNNPPTTSVLLPSNEAKISGRPSLMRPPRTRPASNSGSSVAPTVTRVA
jgi:hypothetical protein